MIHITCSLDSKYTRFAGVLMTSIFENNKDEKIMMHIMGFQLTDNDKKDLKHIVEKYQNEITFYDIKEEIFKDFSTKEQWNIATYFRLLLPELININVKRVLYVDCDIIFRGEIRELYDIDLENNIIGAVEDHVLSPRISLNYSHGIYPENFYFNAGVLLIDLQEWRKYKITEKCFEYLHKYKPMHLDQDTLNAVLQGKWKHLSYRYNFMSDFHTAYFNKKDFEMDIRKKYPFYPIIIHFTGTKPWHHTSRSVYKVDFFRYQSMTKWKDMLPKHTFKDKIINIVREFCDKTGIKKKIPFTKYDFDFKENSY